MINYDYVLREGWLNNDKMIKTDIQLNIYYKNGKQYLNLPSFHKRDISNESFLSANILNQISFFED